MSYLINSQIEAFAFIVCTVLLFDIYQRKEKKQFDDNIFLALLISNMLILLIDALGWAIDGVNTPFLNEIYVRSVFLYLIMNPVLPYLWLLYTDYQIFKDRQRLRRLFWPYLIPVLLILIFIAINPFTNALFYIDSDNVYHRGTWFPVFMILTLSYMVYALILIIRNRFVIGKHHFLPLAIFPLPPLIGAVIQILFYGVALIWTGITLSLLIIYINVQNRKLDTDYLTGLYNRNQLDRYLNRKINESENFEKFSAIMIDIDGFKKINDQYGHIEGDAALEITANILKISLRKNDFLARYGGDEFMVIIDIDNMQTLEETVARINDSFNDFNQTMTKPYVLTVSMGYDLYDPKISMNTDQFIKRIDLLMYENKTRNKYAANATNGKPA